MTQYVKSALHIVWLALSFQIRSASVGDAANIISTGFSGGLLVFLGWAGRELDSRGLEPEQMPSDVLVWVLPLGGAAVLLLVAGARIHRRTVSNLRVTKTFQEDLIDPVSHIPVGWGRGVMVENKGVNAAVNPVEIMFAASPTLADRIWNDRASQTMCNADLTYWVIGFVEKTTRSDAIARPGPMAA